MATLKTLKYKYCCGLGTCHEYVYNIQNQLLQFSGMPNKLAFLNMPVLNTINENNFDLSGHF